MSVSMPVLLSSRINENVGADTIICVASGPSLISEDILLAMSSGCRIIAVNNAIFMLGLSKKHISYSADMAWWRTYFQDVSAMPFERWSCNDEAVSVYQLHRHPRIQGEFNSGQHAIYLASYLGAKRIVLLGYDCSLRYGLHFHGSHKYQLSNPSHGSIIAWQRQFHKLALDLEDVEIINCSRYSELTCFKRIELEKTLNINEK